MRVLHPLRETETPVCSGEYSYLLNGEPSGQVEQWQITRLPDGNEIVRADIDGRKAPVPYSLVTHMLRGPDGRPLWLRLRYVTGSVNGAAQYNFEAALVRVARQAEHLPRRMETVEIAENYAVDYPPVIGHDYVWRAYPGHAQGKPTRVPVFSADLWADQEQVLGGRALRYEVAPRETQTCVTPVGVFEDAQHFQVTMSDGIEALVWYDRGGIPLRWLYPAKGYDFVLTSYTHAGGAQSP